MSKSTTLRRFQGVGVAESLPDRHAWSEHVRQVGHVRRRDNWHGVLSRCRCRCMAFARSFADVVAGTALSHRQVRIFWEDTGLMRGYSQTFRGAECVAGAALSQRSCAESVAAAALLQGEVPTSWQAQQFRKAGAGLSHGHAQMSWHAQRFRKSDG